MAVCYEVKWELGTLQVCPNFFETTLQAALWRVHTYISRDTLHGGLYQNLAKEQPSLIGITGTVQSRQHPIINLDKLDS